MMILMLAVTQVHAEQLQDNLTGEVLDFADGAKRDEAGNILLDPELGAGLIVSPQAEGRALATGTNSMWGSLIKITYVPKDYAFCRRSVSIDIPPTLQIGMGALPTGSGTYALVSRKSTPTQVVADKKMSYANQTQYVFNMAACMLSSMEKQIAKLCKKHPGEKYTQIKGYYRESSKGSRQWKYIVSSKKAGSCPL